MNFRRDCVRLATVWCLLLLFLTGFAQSGHRRSHFHVALVRKAATAGVRKVYLHLPNVVHGVADIEVRFASGKRVGYVTREFTSLDQLKNSYITNSPSASAPHVSPADITVRTAISIPDDGNEPALSFAIPPPHSPTFASTAPEPRVLSEMNIVFHAQFKKAAHGETRRLYAVIRQLAGTQTTYDPTDFDDVAVSGVSAPTTGFRSAVEVQFSDPDDKKLGSYSFTFNEDCAEKKYIIFFVWFKNSNAKEARGSNVGRIEFGPKP